MMRRSCRAASISLLSGLLAAFVAEAAFALTGEITHLSGAVVARRDDGHSRILSTKSEVREGDLIVTAENSYVRMRFGDGGDVVLRPNTQLKIDAYSYDEQRPQSDNVLFSLIKGGLRSVTGLLGRRNPASFHVVTPNATIGIRGTTVSALMCSNDCGGILTPSGGTLPDGLHMDVADGVIVVSNRAGSIELRVGEFGYVQSLTVLPVQIPSGQGTPVPLPRNALKQSLQSGTVGNGDDLECRF